MRTSSFDWIPGAPYNDFIGHTERQTLGEIYKLTMTFDAKPTIQPFGHVILGRFHPFFLSYYILLKLFILFELTLLPYSHLFIIQPYS